MSGSDAKSGTGAPQTVILKVCPPKSARLTPFIENLKLSGFEFVPVLV